MRHITMQVGRTIGNAEREQMMRRDRRRLSIGLLALALVVSGCAVQRVQPLPADCPDIAETGRLNVLT